MNDDGDPVPGVTHPEREDGPVQMRRRRVAYVLMQVSLCTLAALVVLDIWLPVFGVDTDEVVAESDAGTVLRVEYPAVTRPALATAFAVEVHDPDGFEAPIEIALSRPWVEAWDENALLPDAAVSTGDPDWVVHEFDPPDGETFRVFYDIRLEPSWQRSVTGTVQLRSDGEIVAEVDFDTKVRP